MRTDCIADDVIAARAANELDAALSSSVDAHVADCESCRVVLSELARTTGERPARDTLGRYVLEEELGSGGMGTVWAAFDPKLGRRVAVKLGHEARRDAARTQRFVAERQILAALEHPNIGRLLDGGETDDARPWFAMELVDGQPIDAFCDSRNLSTRQRLELMERVCAAVSYAHQRLVVHRDLKPSNVLVTTDGVPKLVDFGIAKLLDDAGTLTVTGMTPMTPAFAAPEQVRREPATTSVDVYALGVMLYELLTGTSPYAVEPNQLDALLAAIREVDPSAPSASLSRSADAAVLARAPSRERLRRELEGDLDAIVLMALRKDPRDRYASVDALAGDLRAYLDGRPTAARRGSRLYRAVKFARRNRTAVAAATAFVVALVAGLVATAWQARAAARERDLAQRRFSQVRSLAHSVLFDYHDGIASLPGSTALRERLAKDALAYLDSLATDARGDVTLQRELSAAYLKLGDVQGSPVSASLGDTTAAKASYLRARGIAEAVLVASPGDFEARKTIAAAWEKAGALLEVSGELNDALAAYEQSRAGAAALVAERPDDDDARYALSMAETGLGQVSSQLGKLDDATRFLEKALASRELLAKARPDARTRRGLALVHLAYAGVLQDQYRMPDARAHFEAAERLLGELAKEQPGSADFRRALANALMAHGDLERRHDQDASAERLMREALTDFRALLAADPENAVARRDVVVALGGLSDTLNGLERYAESKKVLQEALEIAKALARSDESNVQAKRDLAQLHLRLAEAAQHLKDYVTSEAEFRATMALAEPLAQADPHNQVAVESLADAHNGLANLLGERKQTAAALEENRLAAAQYEALLQLDPSASRVRTRYANVLRIGGTLLGFLAFAEPTMPRQLDRLRETVKVLQQASDEYARLEAAQQLIGFSVQDAKLTRQQLELARQTLEAGERAR